MTAIHLYRIVQEALTNVARHAAADKVSIRITRLADAGMELSIRDDGRGFDEGVTAKGMTRDKGQTTVSAVPSHRVR